MKLAIFFAILGLALTSVSAADVPAESRAKYYRPCPCRCLIGFRKYRADRVCRSFRFRLHCEARPCYYHGKPGRECCDIVAPPKPTTTASATPTPSVTPTPSITPTPSKKPVCPCVCSKRRDARRACRYLPYCEIQRCPPPEVHHPVPHYYKPRPEFECCYKEYVAPHH